MTQQTRVLPLEGIHNFRDYGGYAAADGARVVSGVLWRSAQHGDATDADLDRIRPLHIRTVIDLRGISERQAKPCRRYPGFAGEVLFHEGETAGLHMEAASGAPTADEARAAMTRLYAGIAFRPNLVPMLQRYFRALEQREGSSLVHCVAGKDRTGFAVALFQHLLGVHWDDVLGDYVLTNEAGNIEARIASGAEQIRGRYGPIDDATVRALMGVEPGYLETAFAAVKTEHGTVEAYLADVLGVDSARVEALRGKFLTA